MTNQVRTAVLLVAHGTVEDLRDLPEFLLRIRRGRAVSPEVLAEVQYRYATIGGSPLLQTTERQSQKLSKRLGLPCFVGMRFWDPSIADGIRQAVAAGVQHLVVLPLAPFSVSVYCQATRNAAEEVAREGGGAPELIEVLPWGSEAALLTAHAQAIQATYRDAHLESAGLILTAHSLPLATIEAGDRYADEVTMAARGIEQMLGRSARLAYQSRGAMGGRWLEPTLEDTLTELAQAGAKQVVVAPMGFLADHVETLYDLDVEARNQASQLGLAFHRVPAMNDTDAFIEAAARVVEAALERHPSTRQ